MLSTCKRNKQHRGGAMLSFSIKQQTQQHTMNKFRVIFTYDEPSRKWETTVEGAENETEAKQGFNAVVITAREAHVCLEHKTTTNSDGSIKLIPATYYEHPHI